MPSKTDKHRKTRQTKMDTQEAMSKTSHPRLATEQREARLIVYRVLATEAEKQRQIRVKVALV